MKGLVWYALVSKIAIAVGSLLTLFLVAIYLNDIEKGIYFLIFSFSSFLMLMDMGLAASIMQIIGHEYAKENKYTETIYQVIIKTYTRYFKSTVLIIICAIVYGYIYIKKDGLIPKEYYYLWVVIIILMIIDYYQLPLTTSIESMGRVKEIYRYRIFRALLLNGVIAIGMMTGLSLYSLILAYSFNISYSIYFFTKKEPLLIKFLLTKQNVNNTQIKDFNNLQLKYFLTYAFGYLGSYTLIPIAFSILGPTESGKLGFTLSILTGISNIALSIIYINQSKAIELAAKRKIIDLKKLILKYSIMSLIINIIGFISFYVFLMVIEKSYNSYINKFLNFTDLLIFMSGALAINLTVPASFYLRSFKQEPLTVVTGIGGVLSIIISYYAAKHFGMHGIAIGYLILNAIVLLPLVYLVYINIEKGRGYGDF